MGSPRHSAGCCESGQAERREGRVVSLAQSLAEDTQPAGPRWEPGRSSLSSPESVCVQRGELWTQPPPPGAAQEHTLLQGKEQEEQWNVCTAAVPYQKHAH